MVVSAGVRPNSGYSWAVSSIDSPRGRHRLAGGGPRPEDRGRHVAVTQEASAPRPALLPRSLTVVAAAVGAVFALGVDQQVDMPAPRPHPDAPAAALEPVVPVQRDGRPARIDPVPAGVTGRAIAGAHAAGSASMRALDAVAATQPPRAVAPEGLFAT